MLRKDIGLPSRKGLVLSNTGRYIRRYMTSVNRLGFDSNLRKVTEDMNDVIHSLNNRIYQFINKYKRPEIIYEKTNLTPKGYVETQNYVVVEFDKPDKSKVKKYRTKKVFSHKHGTDIVLKFAILNNGKTKLTSIWYPKDSERGEELLKKMTFGIQENIDYLDEVRSLLSMLARPVVRRVPSEVLKEQMKSSVNNSLIPKPSKMKRMTHWRNIKGAK